MTTLAASKARDFILGAHNDLPVIASDIIYEGAAVGENGAGYFRPLVAADPFAGFAQSTVDNSAVADEGSTVYASDDDTFTLTSTSNTAIGKITRYISGTTVEVYFEASSFRSI